jgi:hypothetical protein
MSRSTSAVAVLALACAAAPATTAAQQLPRARFGLGAGVTAPRGEYRDDGSGEGFNTGWQGMVFLEFRAPRKPLGLRVDLVLGENPANDSLNGDATTQSGQPTTVKMRMVGGNVDVMYSLLRSSRGGEGYVLGGVGSYRVSFSTDIGGVTVDVSENKFAWNAGGGWAFPVGRAAMLLELRYYNVATTFTTSKKLPFVALTAGFRFGRG